MSRLLGLLASGDTREALPRAYRYLEAEDIDEALRYAAGLAHVAPGVGLKTLGDLLGHRTAEATCAYLRLATDDLREVALRVPRSAGSRSGR